MKTYLAISGDEIDLSNLDEERQQFFATARAKLRNNVSWFDFESFAFGANSPIYRGVTSRRDVLRDPLYLALKDIWLRLGVKQGLVRDSRLATEKAGLGKTTKKGRSSDSNSKARRRHLATAGQSSRTARRRR
ncbi:MAG TPA: hypothetical protein VGF28_19185 [Thermoanaerobaculia bacterium]|jgi:hypothetical protein